jgi:cytochrome c oxidase subunit 3
MSTHAHPFHLVKPSPWPALGSLAVLFLTFGAVDYFHNRAHHLLLLIGAGIVVLTAALWWRDVVAEAEVARAHTSEVQHQLRTGMALFIASEVMFFVAFFWAFFTAAGGFVPSTPQWPPSTIHPLETWSIPFFNTLILISSGIVLNWGEGGLRKGNRKALAVGLALAIVLGATFLALQLHEYGGATFGFKQGIYPSVFYMATGFHGFHVLIGVCFLSVTLGRTLKGNFTPAQHVGLQAAAWYWHFVDVVWIFLFVWVYWWGNSHGV